jgi:hypothetical protein
VVISMREYERIIERLDGCKRGGLSDLWLAGVGVGGALAVGAFVGALTLPTASSGIRDVLWALTATGAVVLILCLAAYFSLRRERGLEIGELRKDLEIHKDRAIPYLTDSDYGQARSQVSAEADPRTRKATRRDGISSGGA